MTFQKMKNSLCFHIVHLGYLGLQHVCKPSPLMLHVELLKPFGSSNIKESTSQPLRHRKARQTSAAAVHSEDTGAKRKLARLMLSASEPPAKNVPVRPSPVFRSGRARANNRSGAKIHSLLKSAKNETSPITTWNYG